MDSQHHPSDSPPTNTPKQEHHPHDSPPTNAPKQEHHPHDFPPARTQRGIGGIGWAVLGVLFFGSLLAIGILPRIGQQKELKAGQKEASTIPKVNVITPQRAAADTNLVLPGSVVSLNQTTIYARTSGYLRRWLVNFGDRVTKGQLLAEIESPEADQQLLQAQAELAQAQANLVQSRANLAKGISDLKQARANLLLALQTWQRWKVLVQQGVVARQDADTKYATYAASLASVESAQNTVGSDQANVRVAQANIGSSQANAQRYAVLKSYEKVTAPFTGVITARNVDAGVLITAGNGNTSTSLYTIAAYDTLDVNVNVPQTLAQSLQVGQTAQISVRELPQRVFTGKVVRTTNALDPNTRTLLTQLEVPNSDGTLRPGMYATVKFNINRANPPLFVPDSALVINAQGTQVATVTKDQTIHYQKVVLGRDDGTKVEINSGLTGNESLIATPTVDQTEGMRVQPVAQKEAKS